MCNVKLFILIVSNSYKDWEVWKLTKLPSSTCVILLLSMLNLVIVISWKSPPFGILVSSLFWIYLLKIYNDYSSELHTIRYMKYSVDDLNKMKLGQFMTKLWLSPVNNCNYLIIIHNLLTWTYFAIVKLHIFCNCETTCIYCVCL